MTEWTDTPIRSEQPLAVLQGLAERARVSAGTKPFTLVIMDSALAPARRLHLHRREIHPAGGSEPMAQNACTKRTIDRGGVFSTDNIKEIATVFPYFERIQSVRFKMRTNCGKKVTMEVLKTPNCQLEAGNNSTECAGAAEKLQGSGILASLPHQSQEEAS